MLGVVTEVTDDPEEAPRERARRLVGFASYEGAGECCQQDMGGGGVMGIIHCGMEMMDRNATTIGECLSRGYSLDVEAMLIVELTPAGRGRPLL